MKDRDIVLLAALVHDIGKFYQRADDNGLRASKILDQDVKNLESMYCPQYKDRYSHKHVIWTAQFIADYEQLFKEVLGERFSDFFEAAVGHHKQSSNATAQAVRKADHYASGADRSAETGQQDAEAEAGWDKFKHVRMRSVLEGLFQDSGFQYQYSLPVTTADIGPMCFPVRTADEKSSSGPDAYKKLWDSFNADMASLQAAVPQVFAENLLAILHRHTVAVPSSTVHLPDVSLYDHLRSTAALAVCIHDWCNETGKDVSGISGEDEPVLMVGGDLSGIQDFIYNIASSRAAKSLKGRSFYLELMVNSVVDRILEKLELTRANVVYSSGGGFYLLCANTDKNRSDLQEVYRSVQDELWEMHGTRLFLAVTSHPVSQDQIMGKRLDEAWQGLTRRLNEVKRRRYADRLKSSYASFFEPSGASGKVKLDAVTGEEYEEHERLVPLDEKDSDRIVSKHTYELVRLGKELRESDYIVMAQGPLSYLKDHTPYRIPGFRSRHVYLCNLRSLAQNADEAEVVALNKLDAASLAVRGRDSVRRGMFYAGNRVPVRRNEPLTFEDMASGHAQSFSRIGVLRMDVDNLGQAFIRGFQADRRTFSRYAALSRSLDYFFKGYLNHLWEYGWKGGSAFPPSNTQVSEHRYRDHSMILYAGGDDLFIIGRWDIVIDLAQKIHEAFSQYACNNNRITLSGGMAIVDPKFPISRAADEADTLERSAKGHIWKSGSTEADKASFDFLGKPLSWTTELPLVVEIKDALVQAVGQDQVAKGILQRIQTYAWSAEDKRHGARPLAWRWKIAYDFSRLEKQNKASAAILNQLKLFVFSGKWNDAALQSKHSALEILNLAARWAEMELKN